MYLDMANVYERLEAISAKLEKTDILAKLFSQTPPDFLYKVVLLACGRAFPKWAPQEIGIANKMMIKAIARATGFKPSMIVEKFKRTGDLGLVAEECIKGKKQGVLLKKILTVDKVFENIKQLAFSTGIKSQEKKLSLIAELLVSAEPKEARYVVRSILEELRIGVAEGIVRDAIAKAFNVDVGLVEHAWNMLPDFGEVAIVAKEKGKGGLKKIKVEVGKPIMVLLAEKSSDLETALKDAKNPAVEVKYDGMRTQIHKKGDRLWLFTRRLENVTTQFPDLVALCKKAIKVDECIMDGETLGIDPKTGRPLPFQQLSQRVHRKYDIGEIVKKIPVQINLFDIIYLDGKLLFNKTLKERRKILEESFDAIPGKFQLSEQIVPKGLEEAEEFYEKSIAMGEEGVIVKNLNATYQPGRRVAGGWFKVKPIMETLDLVIVGAEWGTGKRAKWLSSYVLASRDPDTGKFLACGMMGTGLTEQQFRDMTETLKPLITKEGGRSVEVKPEVVVEIGYEEIQKSPNYESGYALRFPRLQRTREDKGPEEADTTERLEILYKNQRKVV